MPTRKGYTNNPHGRPPLPADERRTTTSIQLNAITRRKLDELAAEAKLTRSLMVERLIAEAHARMRPDEPATFDEPATTDAPAAN